MKMMFYITSIELGGGAERVMANLANSFAREGNECIMVTSHDSEKKYPLDSTVRHVPLTETRTKGFVKRNFILYRRLRKLVRQEKPEVLISFMAEPNFRAVPACKGTDTKIVVSVRNDPSKEYFTSFHKMLANHYFKHALTVFQTEDARSWFKKDVQKHSTVIMNPVDEKFFDWKYDGERKDVFTAGRLEPQKNHEMLIRAFASIADSVDDNLRIYGEGSLEPQLAALIKELKMENKIFLMGRTNNMIQAIGKAKAFVLSSDFEGMPNALMEALAMGLACVSTDCPCGGPRKLIEDGKNGLLVPVGDEKAMAQALLKLLTDDTANKKMRDTAQSRACSFKPEEIFGQWKEAVSKASPYR